MNISKREERVSGFTTAILLRDFGHRDIHYFGKVIMARIMAILFLILLFGASALEASDSIKILFFPLEDATNDNTLSWLKEGIAYSISQQLETLGLNVIKLKERAALVENMDLPPSAQLSHASMIRAAQRASAGILVIGIFSGTRQNLKISLKVLDIKTMKLSSDIIANGPVVALAQMENELAWLVLSNTGLATSFSRKKLQLKTRKVPNKAYALFIESFNAAENERIALLLKAVEIYRNFQEAQIQLGGLYFRKGDCGKALPHLNMGSSEGIVDPESEFMRGTCYIEENLTDQAVQSLTNVLSSSRFFKAFNNLGVAYLRKGDYGLALNAFLEAKNLDHMDSTLALNLAVVKHLQGNDWAARNGLDEAVKLHPRDGMLHFISGFLFQVQGEKEKAAAAFVKAKALGIKVEKLETQDQRSWARLIYESHSPKSFP
jgi:tetratricopeptide (TPR) repeat protein